MTLNNVNLTNAGKTAAIEFEDNEHVFNIMLKGNNVITSNGGGISMSCSFNIGGGGSLKCTNSNNKSTSIWVRNGSTLSIKDCSLELEGNNGISGTTFMTEKLEISHAMVHATGHQSDAGYGGAGIRQFTQVTLQDCDVTAPYWATYDNQECVFKLNGEVCGSVTIKPATLYNVWVKDKRVSSNNAGDVLNDGGSMTYNADKRTLSMSNATINYQDGSKVPLLFSGDDDYTLELQGNNCINTARGAVTTWSNLTINGGGQLSCQSSNNTHTSIWVCNAKTLTIEKCTVIAKGWEGISGTDKRAEHLVIDEARVEASGIVPPEGKSGAAISQFATFSCINSEIVSPVGAQFDDNLGGVALNQSLCLDVAIAPVSTSVDHVPLSEPAVVAIYDLMGHRLQSERPGLNVVIMSDGTTRKILR